jgi:hypothetical protein
MVSEAIFNITGLRNGLGTKDIQRRMVEGNSPIGSQTSFETDLSGNCGVAHVLSPENSYDSVSNTVWTMTGAPMGGL